MTEPQHVVINHDGLDIAGLDWGGDGPDLLMLHPNGFTAGVYEPVVAALGGRYRCLSIDLRGHGRSDTPPTYEGFEMARQARDVIAWLDHVGASSVLALGQSLGGVVSVLVDREDPGRFSRLLLAEAVIFPSTGPNAGTEKGLEIAAMVRKRRSIWADREEMVDSLFDRGGYTGAERSAMEAYAKWGTIDRPDGQIELACSPDAEASVFAIMHSELGSHPAWEHLPTLNAPTTLLAGRATHIPGELFAAQAEQAGLPLELLESGHLVMQEDAGRAVELIDRHLGVA